MDVDFWASRIHSSKQLYALHQNRHNSSGNQFIIDDLDGDEDFRACFPCPFCYVDIEVHALRSHLQDEHCFDLKNAVCPLCAANLGKDAIGHFIIQHASSSKHRRRSQKAGLWTSNSATLNKELSSFLGSSANARVNMQDVTPDPLLSPFISKASHSEPKGSQKDETLIGHALPIFTANLHAISELRPRKQWLAEVGTLIIRYFLNITISISYSTETSSVGANELDYEE